MGKHEAWAEPPTGLLPNGLLSGEAASVIQALDSDRWAKAEERTAELITSIQPNQPSEERRYAVANYVQRLIMKCFSCQQVFTFGSVPLKTYLPDGDIDLTAFSKNQNSKETWAHQVRDILESEEKNENAEFRVKEVQYIQAEVKIIKCLVENIVVDISFNQLGGLCTLCFLEEVDNLINRNHLFKRSIILIKAWCYYESRILGAHHGLISTYALETLVLYIFHVFNDFAGPLEVLYRFLEFFSKFDWDNYCVSLWGPVPISSLPDVTAEPPRKDEGDLLLSKGFLDACSSVYAVFPSGQENQGLPFVSKHFNVIDPLRVNNNLGRSVSRGNFFRIRSAFAFGAKKLARLIDCPEEDLLFEINEFFMNTWDRHGCGQRPDAPRNDLWLLRPSNAEHEHVNVSEVIRPHSSRSETSSGHEVLEAQSSINVSQQLSHPIESTNRSSDTSVLSHVQSQKNYSNIDNSRSLDQTKREASSKQATIDKYQRSSRPDHSVNDIQGRYLFARTHSSPELTHSYGELPSLGRRVRGLESEKIHVSRMENSRKKNVESNNVLIITDDTGSARQVPSQRATNKATDSVSSSNSYRDDDCRSGSLGEDCTSASGPRGRHDERDLVNVVSSSQVHAFNGQVHMPLNLSAGHLPLNIVSMGYSQRNAAGTTQHIPVMEAPWGTSVPLPPGLISQSFAHYFPTIRLASTPEDSIQHGGQSFGSADSTYGEVDTDYWHEQDRDSAGGFEIENGEFENLKSDGSHQATSTSYGSIPSRAGTSGSYSRLNQKSSKESRVSNREDQVDVLQYQGSREDEAYMDERPINSRSMRPTRSSSLRSRTSSESSWEGSSAKTLKSSREKRVRKVSNSAGQFTSYGKGKSLSDQSSAQADDEIRDLNAVSSVEAEPVERGTETQSLASVPIQTHQLPGFEPGQADGSDSMMPFTPVMLGPGSRQRPMDNSRLLFYPTGPPVPFVAMLPFPYFPGESGGSEASSSHFGGEEGIQNSENPLNYESSDGLDHAEALNTPNLVGSAASDDLSQHKSDILNSDFASHWHNLQYGRFCQTSSDSSPLICPSPGVLSPIYLQGRVPWEGTGRPLSSNMNVLAYGPRLVPVAPMQPVSNGPASIYHVDELPRYRSGTGTYLPNPKVSTRDRNTSSNRRGNYSYDRGEQHADREGNWNTSSKSRARGHNRSQTEKPTLRIDRIAGGDSQNDRTWGSYRRGSFPSYQSQSNPIRASTSQGVPANVSYGMYPLPAMNSTSMVQSNGPIPSVVMLYPYDQNARYNSSSEQLEFGSFGALSFSGVNDVPQLIEGHQSPSPVDERRLHAVPAALSSPDQPSSPHVMR